MYEMIRAEPYTTGALRQEMIETTGCSRPAFEKALRELQVTLNMVRSNDPEVTSDLWFTFAEQYPQLVEDRG